MSSTRFQPGQSGNPNGRPKKRRPNISAFDIIFDKVLSVSQGGAQRELSVDEALQQQALKDALAGKRMAIRKVLKMIEKREKALAKKLQPPASPILIKQHYTADNANEAMRILGIAEQDPGFEGKRWKLQSWTTQAALSRPGQRKLKARDVENIKFFTFDAARLRWPRGRVE